MTDTNNRWNLLKLTVPIGAVVAILVGAFGALQWADAHFALAEDVKQQIGVLRTEVKQNAEKTRDQIRELRIQQLEDKLFELQLKPTKTQSDYALMQRYRDQLQELKR